MELLADKETALPCIPKESVEKGIWTCGCAQLVSFEPMSVTILVILLLNY